MYFYIRLNAGLDRNGNSRRVYVILDKTATIVDALDEYGCGDAEVRKKYPGIADGPTFKVPVREYKEALKHAKK